VLESRLVGLIDEALGELGEGLMVIRSQSVLSRPDSSGARLTQNPRTELAPHSAGLGSCWGLTVIRSVMVMVPAGDEVSQTQPSGPSP
jgi:hypothetical protein